MSTVQISEINKLYANLAHVETESGIWSCQMYDCQHSSNLRNLLRDCINFEFMKSDVAEKMKRILQMTLTYNRCLISNQSKNYLWNDCIQMLKTEFNSIQNYFNSEEREYVHKTIEYIEKHSSDITEKLTTNVEQELAATVGRCLVFPETPRLGHLYREWVSCSGLNDKVTVIVNKGEIANEVLNNYELLLLPGAPNRYLNRPMFDLYLRSLILSGLAERVKFLGPSWSFIKNDADVITKLFAGFYLTSAPTFQMLGQGKISEQEELKEIEFWDENTNSDINDNYESFEQGGSTTCRMISLGKNLYYPIENDAKKVTTLIRDSNTSIWKIALKDPFTELETNDFLVACVGRSETQDLRERAAKKMGSTYAKFVEQQARWKERLEELFRNEDQRSVEKKLSNAGISKANRARFWVASEAIQPASPKDFDSLLQYLKFDSNEIQKIMNSADQYDAILIAEGREASKAILNALDEYEYTKLEMGESIEITLENFGDATYLIAPFVNLLEEEIFCKPSQIRQVIRYSNEGKNL